MGVGSQGWEEPGWTRAGVLRARDHLDEGGRCECGHQGGWMLGGWGGTESTLPVAGAVGCGGA